MSFKALYKYPKKVLGIKFFSILACMVSIDSVAGISSYPSSCTTTPITGGIDYKCNFFSSSPEASKEICLELEQEVITHSNNICNILSIGVVSEQYPGFYKPYIISAPFKENTNWAFYNFYHPINNYCADGSIDFLTGVCIPKNCTIGGGVTGQPCDIRTGAKYRNETDFSYGGFSLTRNYHSLNLVNIGFGIGWHNQYLKNLSVSNDALAVYEGTGRGEPWRKENDVWVGDADSDYLITESTSGYTITLKRGDIHEYDLSGRLLSETDTQGKVKIYEYDAEGRLIKVSNHYQQFITFTYSADGKDHVIKVTDAQGVEYGYEYDINDNLIAVVYPDNDSDPANNPKRLYHYEDINFPNHITGITNANGERYATFAYDSTGKAIESALAPTTNPVGQQRVQLNYQGAN